MKAEIIKVLEDGMVELIDELKESIKSRNQSADVDEDSALDVDDFSHQEQTKDFVRRLAEQLEVAQGELAELLAVKGSKHDEVEVGAMIETKDIYFLVGPSISNAKYGDKKIVCISENGKAFHDNEGLKKGDTLKLGDKKIKILNIY